MEADRSNKMSESDFAQKMVEPDENKYGKATVSDGVSDVEDEESEDVEDSGEDDDDDDDDETCEDCNELTDDCTCDDDDDDDDENEVPPDVIL